jgi:hypothetical protein
MKTKQLTFLLSLNFLFLFSGSVYGEEEVKKEYWGNGKLKGGIHSKDREKDLKICGLSLVKRNMEIFYG